MHEQRAGRPVAAGGGGWIAGGAARRGAAAGGQLSVRAASAAALPAAHRIDGVHQRLPRLVAQAAQRHRPAVQRRLLPPQLGARRGHGRAAGAA